MYIDPIVHREYEKKELFNKKSAIPLMSRTYCPTKKTYNFQNQEQGKQINNALQC